MRSFAVSFARIPSPDGRIHRYPVLPVFPCLGGIEHRVDLLVDTGSAFSFLPRHLVRGVFGIQPEDLPPGESLEGLGGIFRTNVVDGAIRFGTNRDPFEERIPFYISREDAIEPGFALLGREPFFDRFRVDFRMGYRKKGIEGKFILYHE